MSEIKRKLTMAQPVTYEIRVPGELGGYGSDWAEQLTIKVDCKGAQPPVTILFGDLDQAALHGLLRRLYSLGLPLISLNCVAFDQPLA